jgi:hypothetical protein
MIHNGKLLLETETFSNYQAKSALQKESRSIYTYILQFSKVETVGDI